MPVVLSREALDAALDRAYAFAISDQPLPPLWEERAELLAESPSVAFIAAVGAVLLAKAANDSVDPYVIQAKEGSAGAFNLRAAATALAAKRRPFGYDIGSSSDRDPINHGTLVSSPRWDVALDRIREDHKPFFQLILRWLADVKNMSSTEATEALAAYVRVRRKVAPGAAVERVPATLSRAPTLDSLVAVLDGFVGANAEGGACGMALVAAAFRAAGHTATLPSRNDPRRIDITITHAGQVLFAAEVKQIATNGDTARSLGRDAADVGAHRALLAVLPPGHLVDFDRTSVVRAVETSDRVVLRVAASTRELLHEALVSTTVSVDAFCARMPRAFAEALRDIRASEEAIETWASVASRWR